MAKTRKRVTYSNEDVAQAHLNYFRSLPEKQRRHFVAMQYLQLGEGSQHYLSELFGCSRQTIVTGVKELKASDYKIDYSYQRKPGGGRKKKN